MSFECRHMLRGQCQKRKTICQPGEPGCVLYGRFNTPLAKNPWNFSKKNSKKPK